MARQTIRRLGEGACAKMEELGFSKGSVESYRRIFRRYEVYARGRDIRFHDTAVAADFVNDSYGGSKGRAMADRACRVLGYFEDAGEIPGRFNHHDATAPSSSSVCLEAYLADCARRGLSAKTIAARNRDLCQFLWYVESRGAKFPADVDARLIDEWSETTWKPMRCAPCSTRLTGRRRRAAGRQR